MKRHLLTEPVPVTIHIFLYSVYRHFYLSSFPLFFFSDWFFINFHYQSTHQFPTITTVNLLKNIILIYIVYTCIQTLTAQVKEPSAASQPQVFEKRCDSFFWEVSPILLGPVVPDPRRFFPVMLCWVQVWLGHLRTFTQLAWNHACPFSAVSSRSWLLKWTSSPARRSLWGFPITMVYISLHPSFPPSRNWFS